MLTPTFDPFLFSNGIPSELDSSDYILLMRDDHYIIPVPGPNDPTTMAKPATGLLSLSSDLPDGDTVEVFVSLPVSTPLALDQPSGDIVDIDAHLPESPPFPTADVLGVDSSGHCTQTPSLDLTGRTVEDTVGAIGDTNEYTDGSDIDSIALSALVVPSDLCSEQGDVTYMSLGSDIDTRDSKSLTPITTPAATPVPANRGKSREVFDSVIVPMPSTAKAIPRRRSSQPDVINKANDILAVAMKQPRRRSDPKSHHAAPQLSTAEDTFAVRFLEPMNPTSSPTSSTLSNTARTSAARPTSRDNIHKKTEFSPSPASSSGDFEAQIKMLDSQVSQKTSLLASHNTQLDTISPRLNTTLSACNVLAQKRKSLLDERKTLQFRISANYQDLKETKAKAIRLQGRQAEVMEARDKAQYDFDVLMQERRGMNKALANKRLDEALMAKFPDKGARELAKQVGWRPRSVHITDGKEQDMIEPSDDKSNDAGDESVNKRPDWLRIADALIDDDQSLDFADLSGLQKGLNSVDKRVKQEQDGIIVKIESPPPMNNEMGVSLPSSDQQPGDASPGHSTQQTITVSQTSNSDVIFREPGIEDDLDLPVAEITLEKLQAHFKAMEEHKKEAAKMLKVLAGVQSEMKRKQGPGSVGGAGSKKRRLGY